MEHEVFELLEVEAERGTGLLQVVAELLAHDGRDALGELHFQARLDEIPAHHILGIGPGGAVASEYLGARGASEQHGGGAVGEEARGDQVALRTVAPLEGQAAELDGDEEDQLVGIEAGVFGGARDDRPPPPSSRGPRSGRGACARRGRGGRSASSRWRASRSRSSRRRRSHRPHQVRPRPCPAPASRPSRRGRGRARRRGRSSRGRRGLARTTLRARRSSGSRRGRCRRSGAAARSHRARARTCPWRTSSPPPARPGGAAGRWRRRGFLERPDQVLPSWSLRERSGLVRLLAGVAEDVLRDALALAARPVDRRPSLLLWDVPEPVDGHQLQVVGDLEQPLQPLPVLGDLHRRRDELDAHAKLRRG